MKRRLLAIAQATALAVTIFLVPVAQAQAQVTVPYSVNQGDTLYQIGLRYGLPATELAQENGITNGAIYPGQVIQIPTGADSVPYTVRTGDTLYEIAGRLDTSVAQIASLNGLDPNAPLSPGQILTVPTGPLNIYTIEPGDSLYSIGVSYDTTASFLATINNLQSNTVYPAQNIFVPAPKAATSIVYTPAEENLLARLITAEADGQPFAAQVGVGAVVVNRVKSPLFPKTITGVVYEIDPTTGAYQFTPVLNGWINNPASADGITAAQEALAGQDPTNGALYYFNTDAANSWLQSLPTATIIGNLKFAY